MRKISLLFLVILIFASFIFVNLAHSVLAQGRPVEVEYPKVEGYKPEEVTTPIPEYVKYIFNFLIWASGIIALVVLIIGGFQWFTSAGNLERIKEAKERISAALLGLVILFGSWLILTTINPELVVFHLPRLRPIISTLPRGVLVCKEAVDVDGAWQRENNFKYAEEYWEQVEIKKELDAILDKIALKCYSILNSGDIMLSFDNQITDIYFIHGEQIIDDEKYLAGYGAILYEEPNYEGKSQPIYDHLKPGTLGGVVTPTHIPIQGLNPSSIRPFVLMPKHEGGYERDGKKYQVFLFQEYNRNIGTNLEDKGKMYGLLPENWWHEWDDITNSFGSLPGARCEKDYCSPKSIQVLGEYIAILITPDRRNDIFYNEIDNNLDDNLNIVEWVDCASYKSDNNKKCTKKVGTIISPVTITYNCCAQPAVRKLVIISAKVY